MTASDAMRWIGEAPLDRGALPAAGVVWTAAAILHAAHLSSLDVALPCLTAAAVTYGKVRDRKHARQAGITLAAAGGWLTIASALGPLDGPFCLVSDIWLAGTLIGYACLRRHEVLVKAREWRNAKLDWLGRAASYGLNQSHLLDYERTRLGQAWEVDVTGTGKRASAYAAGDLAERIAETEMLAPSRVQVTPGRIAGRIRISVRQVDPWKNSPCHPVLDEYPEITLAVPCSVRVPLTVGQDPETGKALTLPLWDETGSKNVLIVGKKGSGKSTLLSCIRERITAADDAILFDVNLSKAQEDIEWSPACGLAAIGRGERKRALAILRTARRAIEYRGAQPRDEKNIRPSPQTPLIVVMIDEIDTLARGNDGLATALREELEYIATKDRSEAVSLIEAGQRGTAEWTGGSTVRSQMDVVCLGKVSRRGEMHHAAGDMGLMLPDMSTYGEGHPGVWVIAEDGGSHSIGRTFDLSELPDVRSIAASRAESQPDLEPGLVGHLGDAYARLRGRVPASVGSGGPHLPATPPENPLRAFAQGVLSGDIGADDETREALRQAEEIEQQRERRERDALAALDGSMEEALPDDLRETLRRIDARNDDTRRIQAEIASIQIPDVPADVAADATAQRWKQVADAAEIPPGKRERLIALLGAGTSLRESADVLGVSVWTVRTWLERLRSEGVVEIAGKGRAARWVLRPAVTEGDRDDDA